MARDIKKLSSMKDLESLIYGDLVKVIAYKVDIHKMIFLKNIRGPGSLERYIFVGRNGYNSPDFHCIRKVGMKIKIGIIFSEIEGNWGNNITNNISTSLSFKELSIAIL